MSLKAVLLGVLAYVASPLDLIPDFIPGLGRVDDLLVLLAAMEMFTRLAPPEVVAEIEESRAKVVQAEAEVPKAIAQSFRDGTLGIMDYYKLRNIRADTEMRSSIAKAGADDGTKGGTAA